MKLIECTVWITKQGCHWFAVQGVGPAGYEPRSRETHFSQPSEGQYPHNKAKNCKPVTALFCYPDSTFDQFHLDSFNSLLFPMATFLFNPNHICIWYIYLNYSNVNTTQHMGMQNYRWLTLAQWNFQHRLRRYYKSRILHPCCNVQRNYVFI